MERIASLAFEAESQILAADTIREKIRGSVLKTPPRRKRGINLLQLF